VTAAGPVCVGDLVFQIPVDLEPLAAARAVTFGVRHGCLLDAAGQPWCWGDDSDGQLAVASSTLPEHHRGHPSRTVAGRISGAPRMRSLDAGWLHTCGVSTGGDVVCWGDNSLGQLGRPGSESGPSPVAGLPGGTTAVAAGGAHTCALARDGGVWCWGDGSSGQLGQGSASDSVTPVAVTGLPEPAVAIDAGAYHTCALLQDGDVACWGENRLGQIGDGTRTSRSSSVLVQGLTGKARAVTVGSSFSCALLEVGAVQCWGSNELGELGTGTFSTPPSGNEPPAPPTTVTGLGRGVTALFAAGNHACAELEGGGLRCWGANELGQLGDGTVEGRDRPVPWRGMRAKLPPLPATPKPGRIQGLDVSYHSGRVDWQNAVARGHQFGLTLATAGDDFRDPFFAAHWEGMRQAGLVRGAYHFFVAADDPGQQARIFLSQVLFEPGDLAPVVDVETMGGEPTDDLPDRLGVFLRLIERGVGVKPIIYTGPSFWNAHMTAEFGDNPLWIAQYGVDQPTVPAGWTRWQMWQWQGNADLPDVAPMVDLDRLHPDVDLEELLIPEAGR